MKILMMAVCALLAFAATAFSTIFALTTVSRWQKFETLSGVWVFAAGVALCAAAGALLTAWLFVAHMNHGAGVR